MSDTTRTPDPTRTPRSPYAKYGKTPYHYSGLYQNWKHAVGQTGSTDNAEALEADGAFRAREGLGARLSVLAITSDEAAYEAFEPQPRARRRDLDARRHGHREESR